MVRDSLFFVTINVDSVSACVCQSLCSGLDGKLPGRISLSDQKKLILPRTSKGDVLWVSPVFAGVPFGYSMLSIVSLFSTLRFSLIFLHEKILLVLCFYGLVSFSVHFPFREKLTIFPSRNQHIPDVQNLRYECASGKHFGSISDRFYISYRCSPNHR